MGDWIRSLGPSLGTGLPEGFQAILLTSGTTGRPRLVALGRESVLWNVQTLADHLALPEDRLATHLAIPLFHAFGLVVGLFLTHVRGGTLHLTQAGPGILDRVVAPPHPSDTHHLLLAVPAMVRGLPSAAALSDDLRARLSQLEGTSIMGGAPVRRGDLAKLASLFPKMTHTIGYGLTEAGPALTHTSGEMPCADGTLGPPLPGVHLIPPQTGTSDTAGWSFHSPGMASAILSAGSTVWKPVHASETVPTGDLLDRASDGGGYRFMGRAAWAFKKKGETLSPLWIEDALWVALLKTMGRCLDAPMLQPDGLVLAPDPSRAEALVLYVEAAAKPDWTAALDAAILTLPAFVRPDRVVWVPHFPRTVLGKVERGRLSSLHGID